MAKESIMKIINEAEISFCAKFIWLMKVSLEKQGYEKVGPTLLASKIKTQNGKNISRTRVYEAIKQIKKQGLFDVYNTPLYKNTVPESGTFPNPAYRKAVQYLKESVPESGTPTVPESGTLENGIPYKRNITSKGESNTESTETETTNREFHPLDSFPVPTVSDAQSYFKQIAFTAGVKIDADAEGKKFWNHYEAQSWYNGHTPITKWRLKADAWLARIRSGQFEAASSSAPQSAGTSDDDWLAMRFAWVEDYPEHLREEARTKYPRLLSREVSA